VDSVVFDLCRGPGMVAQLVCSHASTERSSLKEKKVDSEKQLVWLVSFDTTASSSFRNFSP
jgi:hypothetical protein